MTESAIELSDPNTLSLIVDSVAPVGATQADKFALLQMARMTGLNPLVREVYLCKFSGRLQVVIGADGWRRMARKTGSYKSGHAIYHRDEAGQVEACTYTVHTMDGGEFSFCCWLREFKGTSPNWVRMPLHMLRVRAEVHCLKAAFGLSGMSEFDDDETTEVVAVQAQEQRRAALNRRLAATATEPPPAVAVPVGVSEPLPAAAADQVVKVDLWAVADMLAGGISEDAAKLGIDWKAADAMEIAIRETKTDAGVDPAEVLKHLERQNAKLQQRARKGGKDGKR